MIAERLTGVDQEVGVIQKHADVVVLPGVTVECQGVEEQQAAELQGVEEQQVAELLELIGVRVPAQHPELVMRH